MNKFQLDKNENLIIHSNREIIISKINWLGYLIIEKKPTIHKLRDLPISIIYGLVFSLSFVLVLLFTRDYVQFSSSFDFVSRYKILEIFQDLRIDLNRFTILLFLSTTVFWGFFKRKTKRWGAYIFFHGKKYDFLLKKKMVQKINKDRLIQLTKDKSELYKVLDNLEIHVKNETM